jgi:hypothetical protein
MEITHIFLTLAVTAVKKPVSDFSCFIRAKKPQVLTGYIAQDLQLE